MVVSTIINHEVGQQGMDHALSVCMANDAGPPLLFLDPLHNTCNLQRLRNLDAGVILC